MVTGDGHLTDAPGDKGRAGELEDDDDDDDDDDEEQPVVNHETQAAMAEAARHVIKETARSIVLNQPPTVPAPLAAMVYDMLTSAIQDEADVFKDSVATALHKRELGRIRQQKCRARKKAKVAAENENARL